MPLKKSSKSYIIPVCLSESRRHSRASLLIALVYVILIACYWDAAMRVVYSTPFVTLFLVFEILMKRTLSRFIFYLKNIAGVAGACSTVFTSCLSKRKSGVRLSYEKCVSRKENLFLAFHCRFQGVNDQTKMKQKTVSIETLIVLFTSTTYF